MPVKYKGWAASSQDPTAIANTVRGLVLTFSSVIILGASLLFHLKLQASDVASLAANVGMMAGAVWTIYGLVLKIVVYFGRQNPAPQP